jgi:hypothetical protein
MFRPRLAGRRDQIAQIDPGSRRLPDKRPDQTVDLGEIDLGRLGQQALLCGRRELVEEGEDLPLSRPGERVDDRGFGHGEDRKR